MDEENENLIEYFSKLPTNQKRRELGLEIAETNFLIEGILNSLNPNIPLTPPDNYDNLLDGKISEDEYLTGLYDDFLMLQENLSIALDALAKPYMDEEGEE